LLHLFEVFGLNEIRQQLGLLRSRSAFISYSCVWLLNLIFEFQFVVCFLWFNFFVTWLFQMILTCIFNNLKMIFLNSWLIIEIPVIIRFLVGWNRVIVLCKCPILQIVLLVCVVHCEVVLVVLYFVFMQQVCVADLVIVANQTLVVFVFEVVRIKHWFLPKCGLTSTHFYICVWLRLFLGVGQNIVWGLGLLSFLILWFSLCCF